MNISGGIGFDGRVKLRVKGPDGATRKLLDFKNVVLAVGLENFISNEVANGKSSAYGSTGCPVRLMNYLYLGTGTTEPDLQDSGLESRSGTLAGKQALGGGFPESPAPITTIVDEPNHYYAREITFTFQYGQGEAEGVWTELGLADDVNYSTPFSRALIRDDNGDPVSLTILSDEYLEVFYTVRFNESMPGPQTGQLTLGGAIYDYTFTPVFSAWRSGQTSTSNGYFRQKLFGTGGYLCFPFVEEGGWVPSGALYSGPVPTTSVAFDPGTRKITMDMEFGPTTNDETLNAVALCRSDDAAYGYGGPLHKIEFSPGVLKKADYKVNMTIEIDIAFNGPPVSGVVASAATATSLEFTWDAYPSATEYALVLRQAGTVIEEQAIAAPTTTASFAGLTAATEYHLDIQPKTAGREGARSIHAATTGAA